MRKLPPFTDSDERDEARYRINRIEQAGEDLAAVRSDPALIDYRLVQAGEMTHLLPTQVQIELARGIIEQVAHCLRHAYDRRRRFDDPPLPTGPSDDLDNEHPF